MFTFTLTPQQTQTVLNALGKMPLEHSLEAFTAIQQQLQAQNRPTAIDKEAAD
jgi:hypothetical protein